MENLFITNSIVIEAGIEETWDALTNPAKTKVYMFGCETVSNWKQGDTLLWKGQYEGVEIIFVKGQIIEIDTPNKLVYSTFDPNSSLADLPENYLHVTYELEENMGSTTLKVTQGDYSTVAEGQRRYQESWNNGEGWNPILTEIKKMLNSK